LVLFFSEPPRGGDWVKKLADRMPFFYRTKVEASVYILSDSEQETKGSTQVSY